MGEQRVSNLERRYRRLLRVLPRWYRDDREEEMVGIFLAGRTGDLDQEHGWPGWGETWAVLGLAVRTHLGAGAALSAGVNRRGEVVRALGVIGLLVGLFQAGVAITSSVVSSGFTALAFTVLLAQVPVAAFVALLAGQRTAAKLLALASVLPGLVPVLAFGAVAGTWWLFQLPALVTFVCLCLGFHREAPTPPVGRLAWWGGGALLLGLAAGPLTATVVLIAALVVVRVVALVRGDFVLGRALSVFALLELGPVVLLLLSGTVVALAVALVVVLVVSAVAPVRKPRFS
ncbi:hypothetical protein [Lentzea sp.]|uniref:hypothetical protein n=1 Tax=Lentzea sp. TaxID=56099 RepID=UPI002ED19882